MTSFDDPAVVRAQYASEANLRARQALWTEVECENAPDVLWRILESLAPRNVLEVGGGQGELAERMQRELGVRVSFLDQSERMVELAGGRGVTAARVGDAQDLPFDDDSFDTVVAAWMLYHVPDVDRALAEAARVLQPNGRFVATTNSIRHIEELRQLLAVDMEKGFLDREFHSENGEELLRRHFRRVERTDVELVAVVRDRATLVAYRNSLSYPSDPVPEDVELPFRVHGRSTIFVATP